MVVVVVIVAIIAVALIAGWFGGSSKPTVSFSSVTTGGFGQNRTAIWVVTSVSQQNSFSSYKVVLDRDATALGAAQTLVVNSILSLGANVNLIVIDTDTNGKLSVGDGFLAYGMTPGHSWNFRLLWSDGSWIQSAEWGGTSSIAIGISLQSTGSNWTMMIASISGSVAYADVFMTIADAGGVNVPAMTSVSLADLTPANWGTHHVTFQNTGGGSDLTVGSSILVDRATYFTGYRYMLMVNAVIVCTGTFA